MAARWIALLALLFAAPVSIARGAGAATVALLGDSLTTGEHTTPADPVGSAYLLRDRIPDAIYLFACASTTTDHWAKGVPRSCTFIDPDADPDPTFSGPLWAQVPWSGAPLPLDLLVVFLGTNDAIQGISPATYGANLQAIVDYVFANDIASEIYLVKPSLFFYWPQLDAALLGYGQEIDAIAASDSRITAGVDLAAALNPAPTLNDWPHAEVADLLEPEIVSAVPEPGVGVLGLAAVFCVAGLRARRSSRR